MAIELTLTAVTITFLLILDIINQYAEHQQEHSRYAYNSAPNMMETSICTSVSPVGCKT